MTLQRNVSPIPPGRYWLTVLGDNRDDFTDWVRDMEGAVVTTTTEEDLTADPPWLFVIFVVPPDRAPFFDAGRFGFPNIAPASINSHQDAEQAPDEPLDWSERLQTALSGMTPMTMLVLAGVAYFALTQNGKGRR